MFFGEANCSSCHSGILLTDQQHYALAVPQVGPGKGSQSPLDLGRWGVSEDIDDMYAFRTPSLHNVAVSAPYMHDGAFSTLETAVLHHLDPQSSLSNYDVEAHIPSAMHDTFQNNPALIEDMLSYVPEQLVLDSKLSRQEIDQLIAFLQVLTDPQVTELDKYIPIVVPSGLPVEEDQTIQTN